MWLEKIKVQNFRNIKSCNTNFSHRLNLITGKNAQGKTNFLEAIYYLCTLNSFRGTSELDIINWQENYFYIQSEIQNNSKKNILEASVLKQVNFSWDNQKQKITRQIKIDSKSKTKLKDYLSCVQIIYFSPDDLAIIKGTPALRREFLDTAISLLDIEYREILLRYQKILKQRNNLLESVSKKMCLIDALKPWNEQLVETGTFIIKKRMEYLKKLLPFAIEIMYKISSEKENFETKYISFFQGESCDIKQKFIEKLEEIKNYEIIRNITLVGPHRDDVIFYINDKDAKNFCSQGQIRTICLGLKLAQLKLVELKFNCTPILLLDDVFSELDDTRAKFVLETILAKNIQTFITTTTLKELSKYFVKETQIFTIESGILNITD